MNKTLVIAEAGVNHNGDLATAYGLIEAAAAAGADIVKFQTFQAKQLATNIATKAPYQKKTTGSLEGQASMLTNLELTPDDHVKLINYSNKCGIKFLSTAFDDSSIQLLASLCLDIWKIPSGEITNIPYLRKIGKFNQSLILSTGMATMGEIELAINTLELSGTVRDSITLLHCTTEYPAPIDEVNLSAMQSLSHAFRLPVGYSDHTEGIVIPIAAVALGATVIEKHLTLDRSMDGPDHMASLEPDDFTSLVQGIRAIETALGDGIKRPSVSEQKNMYSARKSLVAKKEINIGDLIDDDMLTAKRPANGLSPSLIDFVVGKKSNYHYNIDDPIDLLP